MHNILPCFSTSYVRDYVQHYVREVMDFTGTLQCYSSRKHICCIWTDGQTSRSKQLNTIFAPGCEGDQDVNVRLSDVRFERYELHVATENLTWQQAKTNITVPCVSNTPQ